MSELYFKNKQKNNSNISLNESHQQESKNNLAVESETINTADDIESILVHDDYEKNSANPALVFDSVHNIKSIFELLLIIQQSCMMFLLELREQYLFS